MDLALTPLGTGFSKIRHFRRSETSIENCLSAIDFFLEKLQKNKFGKLSKNHFFGIKKDAPKPLGNRGKMGDR